MYMVEFLLYIFYIIVLLFSVVIHEVAHGWMALKLGDPTAKYAGRLSINPIHHLDPVGSILVPLFLILARSHFLFGWAKPVPINPYNFRDQKYGSAKVALAGAGANLLIALVMGLIIRFFAGAVSAPAFFSLIDAVVIVNLILAVFNLIPLPPLDGSHVLFAFLPLSAEKIKIFLNQFGLYLLFAFIIFGGFGLLDPIISKLHFLLTGYAF